MNILNQYEWNNPKEIDNKKLLKEFTKASLPNKIAIYRFLSKTRKNNLKKLWEKEKKEKNIKSFLEHAKHILVNFKDYINIGDTIKDSDIKNTYELWLICGIIGDIGVLPLSTEKAIDQKQDKISFETTKNKMIEWLEVLHKREWGEISISIENKPLEDLKKVKYVKQTTQKNWELIQRNNYLKMMKECGIGKERAKELISKLEEWSKSKVGKETAKEPSGRSKICNFFYKLDSKSEDILDSLKNIAFLTRLSEDEEFREIREMEHNKNNLDEWEKTIKKLFKILSVDGINKDNYKEALSQIEDHKEYLENYSFNEFKEANEYYEFIRKRALKI